MAKDPYSHDFILISEDSSEEKQPPIPYKTQTQRVLQAKSNYQKQMDNYSEMLQKAFDNWPQETVVGRDTLTWLSKDSHTYMLKSLPMSMWEGIGNHEKDHHAVSSAKQTAAYDYFQNIFLWSDSKDLKSINDYMEDTDWLQRSPRGEFTIEKELNHEPNIRKILLDYLKAMEENNDR